VKRALFVIAAALLAAATANPIVESIANSGIFGGGYADHDQSSVGPTLAIAALFALAFVVTRTVRMLRGTRGPDPMLTGLARDLARRRPASDLPIVIALQFVVLFAMERVECLTSGGTESGLAWLGGPILFAVAMHALIGIGMTFALGYALRSFARVLATAVRAVLEAIAIGIARSTGAAFATQTFDVASGSSLAHVRSIRGRAPPYAPTRA
jgi:hypothetical protein